MNRLEELKEKEITLLDAYYKGKFTVGELEECQARIDELERRNKEILNISKNMTCLIDNRKDCINKEISLLDFLKQLGLSEGEKA